MSAIRRWTSSAAGRSHTVEAAGLVWTVANAREPAAGFEAQVRQALDMLDAHLQQAGSARTHLLSVQVLLADVADRPAFDALWREWIGADPSQWPQRSVLQAALAPGLRVELVAVGGSAGWAQQAHGPAGHN